MPDPEVIDDPIGTDAPEPTTVAKELGGVINEEGKFETDFGSVIDDIHQKIPAKEIVEEPEKAAVETEKKAEITSDKPVDTVAVTRDADLDELGAKLDLKTKPKTKEIIDGFKGKVTQERNQREQIAKERDDLKKQLEERSKSPVPKEVTDELEQLRQTVQELDAARDPALQAKYDKKVAANEDAVVKILKDHGFGNDANGKEIPGAVEALRKQGLTRKNLEEKISALAKAGEHESAEELRDLLRENSRLGKEKLDEIEKFKATAGDRKKTAEGEMTRQVEAANKRMTEEFQSHVAKFDFLKEPAPAKPEDPPAVKQEKEKAILAFNDRVNRFAESIKKETGTATDAQISARIGILYREQVVPQLQAELAALKKANEELTTQVKGLRGAGNLGGKGNAGLLAPAPKAKGDADPRETYEDAVDAMARQQGLIK